MIKIDLQSRTPIYEQLQEQILRLSLLGVLDQNEQLPSVRALAREIGVNPNTVAKAYQELERQGIIYTVPGRQLCLAGCAAAGRPQAGGPAGGVCRLRPGGGARGQSAGTARRD